MKRAVRAGFSIENGWNNVGSKVIPWSNCLSSANAEKAVGLKNFNCSQTNWNFYGSCIDQGLLYYEYMLHQKSAILKPFIYDPFCNCIAFNHTFRSRHYQGGKPWNECKKDRDHLFWDSWKDVKLKYPMVNDLDCAANLDKSYLLLEAEGCFATKPKRNGMKKGRAA